MPTPSETVRAFLSAWEKPGAISNAIRTWFTPETRWENVGLLTTMGPDEGVAFITTALESQYGKKMAIKAEMLALAEVGDMVLTERVDRMIDADGETIHLIRCMGIFEVRDGKIVGWRDYFDTLPFASARAEHD